MEQSLLLVCKCRDESVVLKINTDIDYDDLFRMISENFKDVLVGEFSLSYSVPEHPICLLRKNSELQNMIDLVRVLELKYLNVSVNICSDSVSHGLCDAVSVSERDVAVSEVTECDGALVLSLCPLNSQRVLMSNSWSDVVSHVGQSFTGGVVDFRNALCKYSIERGFSFNYVKNTKTKVVAVCSKKYEEGCEWSVTASMSKVNGFFYIKKLGNDHTCGLLLNSSASKRMGSKLISELIVDLVRGSPSLTPGDVVNHFQNNYGLSIPYCKAWRAMEKARGMVFGDFEDSFKEIGWYVCAMNQVNPGSCIVVDVDDSSRRFRRMFVAFRASIEGFRFCRPLLFIDGTFLKSRFKGVILSATGKDGNQGLAFFVDVTVLMRNSNMACHVTDFWLVLLFSRPDSNMACLATVWCRKQQHLKPFCIMLLFEDKQ